MPALFFSQHSIELHHFIMKPLLLIAVSLLISSGAVGQANSSLTIDPAASKLLWTASKVTGEHSGGVPVKSGALSVKDGELASATVTMDMTGITCTDIENEGANAKFLGHLRSPDFFDVEQHGAATFTTTAMEKLPDAALGKPNYRVTGDLTIKGITHPNTFDVLFWMSENEARAAASFTFDRTKYDIKYRSGTFFPEIGDKAISDTVSLTFDVIAR